MSKSQIMILQSKYSIFDFPTIVIYRIVKQSFCTSNSYNIDLLLTRKKNALSKQSNKPSKYDLRTHYFYVYIDRFLCKSESRVFVQAPYGIFHFVCVFTGGDASRPFVVLFLDWPRCSSGTRILGNHDHTYSHRTLWFHESRNAASQLHESPRFFLVGQFRVYLSLLPGVCGRVEHGSWA